MSAHDGSQSQAQTLERARIILEAALGQPQSVDDETLQHILSLAIRLYALKAEDGMRTPLPVDGGGVTVDETMLTVTDLLHALNVQLFELSMWQAMSGNCIAPHQRVDIPG